MEVLEKQIKWLNAIKDFLELPQEVIDSMSEDDKLKIKNKIFKNEVEPYLNTNLQIIRIDDGEEHFIVAESKENAIKYFLQELNFENVQECDLEIRELQNDEDIQINLNSDDDLLLELINRYRNVKERIEKINIWDLLKYNIIQDKLQRKEIELPYVICSSTFS